ncbi:MAG: NCS2 family permease [Traorella sp.]
MLEKLFKLEQHGTNVKTELLAGLTTFLAMAYILAVNPSMLGLTGMSVQAVFLATAIASGFASIVMGLVANYPIALAPGMGVNAFFTYTVCLTYGYSWQAALAAVFVSGLVFVVISVTGIRKTIINAIPPQLKLAIGGGIGFFIAFIGLINAGIIVDNASTLVGFGNFRDPVVLLSIFGVVVTIVLLALKVKAGVFWGLLITAVCGVILGLMGIEGMPTLPSAVVSVDFDFSAVFAFLSGFGELFSQPTWPIVLFSFLFVDFFDTAGTLMAVANRAGLVNEKGELDNVERALLADAVGTVTGACLGTSTVTSFVESTSGVEVGGRSGLTAVTTGVLFLLSVFLSPLLVTVTSAVTAPALIVVGILMSAQLGGIDWNDFPIAASSFMVVAIMILSYSISNGIAVGFLVYTIAMLASKRGKDLNWIIYVLDIIFLLYFYLG